MLLLPVQSSLLLLVPLLFLLLLPWQPYLMQ
jgi:hypothetical protein